MKVTRTPRRRSVELAQTVGLMNPAFKYIIAANTNIRLTFDRARAEIKVATAKVEVLRAQLAAAKK